MSEPSRILIVRPSALGDVCRTVPILATLRRAWPDAVIDWVVQSDFAAAIACHPGLTEVVGFPRREFARWWYSPTVAAALARWVVDLGRRRYDLVIDFQGLGRSGLITWATRAPRRVGSRSARELGWLGCNVRHPVPPDLHTVERMMALLVAEGVEPIYDMRLYAAPDDLAWWAGHREDLDGAVGPYAVLAPTSRWPSKCWPQPHWSALIGPLRERGLSRIVLVGAPSERHQVDRITAGDDSTIIDLVGRTDIGRTMAVIAGAALVIANDSAPLHMAVGFQRPCIGLYGPTDPDQVGPWGAQPNVLRASSPDPPQGQRTMSFKDPRLGDSLMRLIKPSDVLDRVDHLGWSSPRIEPASLARGRPA